MRTSGAVAIVLKEKQMTYAGPNQRADNVPGDLRALGIGPDVPVGICVQRSFEMVTPALAEQSRKGRASPEAIVVAATFTAEPMVEALEFWLCEVELPAQIEASPYNQAFQQLLAPTNLVSRNTRGLNVLLVRLKDWAPPYGKDAATVLGFGQRTERTLADLIYALAPVAGRNAAEVLLCICPSSKTLALHPRQADFFGRMHQRIANDLAFATNVHSMLPEQLAALYPVNALYHPRGDELGHVPDTAAFFTALATMIARKFNSLKRPGPKAIVLDCDQTLWAGVCGEDGPDGIELSSPYRALQEFMRVQLDAGRRICLCLARELEQALRASHHETLAPSLV